MSSPREVLESEREWVVTHTKAALPILIDCAKKEQLPLTYTDLNEEVAKKLGEKPHGMVSAYHMVLRHIDRVLNSLSDNWTEGEIPPLGVLGIRQQDELPGAVFDPYLSRYLAKTNHGPLTASNREGMVKLARQAVYAYPHWDVVAAKLGIVVL